MSTFFSDFPKINLRFDNLNTNTISYTDIYRFIDVNELTISNYGQYEWYEIGDGERPDHVSNKLYGSPIFYWTFFIINERMKNGIHEWPLSDHALDKFINEKYNKYGVCTIVPATILSTNDFLSLNWKLDCMKFNFRIDLMNDLEAPIAISNFLNGLDLTGENAKWLRVKRVASNLAQPPYNQYAEIKDFDRSRYQLWLKNNKDPFFFSNINESIPESNIIQLVLINPYQSDTLEYSEVEATNDAWLESAKSWYEQYFGTYVGNDFKKDLQNELKFYALNFYEEASTAPDYFIDGITGEPLCNLSCNIFNTGVPVPNYESERTANENKRKIRVLKNEYVRRFADAYEDELNRTGRLNA